MRLIFDSEAFKGIALRASKEEITEEGIPIDFKVHAREGIMFGAKEERKIFLSANIISSLEHIRHFILEKKNPGVIIISDRPYLHANELMNKILLNKIIRPHNIIFLGQHIYAKAERTFITQNRFHSFPMREISIEGHMEVSESVMSIAKKWSDCFILVDSTCLDSSVAKTNWAGGLTLRELIFFVQRFKRLHNFKASELVIPPAAKKIAVKLLVEMYR
ncbi:hypothetical protein CL619_01185 [archaeon]|nr:hypothetical protein [archaeon]|tara:strand:- start:4527 stop:5183 length:657 start_codon:yes stop_codon:yes gene_type:complete